MTQLLRVFIICSFLIISAHSQELLIDKIEPPNWWVGMNWNRAQLMVYGSGLTDISANFNDEHIRVEKVHDIENSNYAFIDIIISDDLEPGTYELILANEKYTTNIDFPVLGRETGNQKHQGFNSEDIIYLITPDRFANGNPDNDTVEGMRDKWSRKDKLGRKGGDIQGIIDRLDYIKDLGFTAIWINPLVENDMEISYHGYGATDFYQIDPRFGTNDLYKNLIKHAHDLELKVIMDHVVNHIGIFHPWMKNLPTEDWLNGSEDDHENNNHNKASLIDLYADSVLKNNVLNGWFVDEMPDLNQKNPFLANYIIQNTLWWIEYAGIDGIREDTYPYADQRFLSKWAEAILHEYPNFTIVGEVWIHDPVFLSAYQTGSYYPKEFDSNLPSVTDFGLFEAFGRVFNRNQSINEVYRFLSRDFIYPNPDNLVTFLDNHDVMRAIDLVKGDIQRFKMALKILLTTRGIPQIYYGTEIGLKGGNDHGFIRRSFPGGFPGDERNAFKKTGRTKVENDIWEFMKSLIAIRKSHPALSKGKLTHLPVSDEFYIYFRSYKNERILLIANNNPEDREFDIKLLESYFSVNDKLKKLKTNVEIEYSPNKKLSIKGYDVGIYKIMQSK